MIVLCMFRLGVVCSVCVMLLVCVCVYGMAWSCCLFIDFIGVFCVRCSVMLSCVVFGVYGLFVVCCVAVCCFIGLSRVCVLLLLFCFRVCFWYGLSVFPVCDCMLYVNSLRCYFSFLCDVVCLFMCSSYGLHLFVYRCQWFVLCDVLLVSCRFCFWCECCVCDVLCCCVLFHWFGMCC